MTTIGAGKPLDDDPADALGALCEALGVLRTYRGSDGTLRRAGDETVIAVLGALGAPVDGPTAASEALAATVAADARRAMAPVVVQWSGASRSIPALVPAGTSPGTVWQTVELEDGDVIRNRLDAAPPAELGATEIDGRRHDRWTMALPAHGRSGLPPGIHRLTITGPRLEASTTLIVAPRCPLPCRGWGVFLPLYALRTERDRGVGTYRDLGELAAWIGGLGGSLVGTVPLYPTFVSERAEPSPYLPVSKLAWNELYVDPVSLPELAGCAEARDALASIGPADRPDADEQERRVDYQAAMARTRAVLEPMSRALFENGGSRRRHELESFVTARPELVAYARFRAACEENGRRWTGRSGSSGIERTAQYYLYAQWAAEEQLGAVAGRGTGAGGPRAGRTGAGLYLDFPVGVHPGGFDPWWEPEAFAAGVHGGAPPDAFFSAGQDWGFPPLHPRRMREDGYRYLRATLRHAFQHAAAVRIDHVMGLHRLYWIPDGADAGGGAYVRYPHDELRALVALEAWRAGVTVVGEDLGTVASEVRDAMVHDRMLRSWVFQFEATVEEPLPSPPAQVLASWGTHDLPRFAAFWEELDIDDREERGLVDGQTAASQRAARRELLHAVTEALGAVVGDSGHSPEVGGAPTDGTETGGRPRGGPKTPGCEDALRAVLRACLSHLSAGPAHLVLVDLEDLWLEREPQNRPGTGADGGNWRRRAALTLSQARVDPMVLGVLADIDRRRRASRLGPGEPSSSTPPPVAGTPEPGGNAPILDSGTGTMP